MLFEYDSLHFLQKELLRILDIIPEAFSSKRKRVEDDQQALAEVKSHILRMWF
jgi:hypothetical protein